MLYVIVGYLLSEHTVSRRMEKCIFLSAIIGLLMHIIGTYFLSVQAGSIVKTYKGYNNVPCILYSIGVFVLIKKYGNVIMNTILGKIVYFLREYTFGIYLVHWYIMVIVKKIFEIFYISSESIIYRLFAPFIIIYVAVVVIKIMRRIPFVRGIVP